MINKHISQIKAGDVILCPDGIKRTICNSNIKTGGFMGTTIWGDSYKLGTVLVAVCNKPVDMK